MKLIDLTGKRFGSLTVLYLCPEKQNEQRVWHCMCDCGKEIDVVGASLRKGITKSCGCKKAQAISKAQREDLTGERFGNLTVVKLDRIAKNRQCKWLCLCDCGQVVSVYASNLKRGHTKSCGCKKGSVYENEVADKLKALKIPFIREARFNDLRGLKNGFLEVDFIIVDDFGSPVAAIEVNGLQHYQASKNSWGCYQRMVSDPIKRDYFQKKKVPLFEIKTWDNIGDKINEVSSFYNFVMSTPCQAPNEGEGVTTILKQEYASGENPEVEVPCIQLLDEDIV